MVHHYLKQARAAYERGDARSAVDLMLNIIGAFPDHPQGYLTLAAVMRDAGQPENALGVLAEMPIEIRDERADAARALLLVDAGRQEAVAAAQRLLKDPATAATGFLVTARMAGEAGRADQAMDLLRRALDADPACAEAMTCMGQLMWRTGGGTPAALEMLARGLEAAPWRSEAAIRYHEAVTALGAYDAAEPVFRRIFESSPGIERTTCFYIDTLLNRGELARAMTVVKEALGVLGASDELLDGALGIQRRMGPAPPSPAAPLVTLCMIVRDEQPHLARCLSSVAPVVGEMVIVDTGSTDRTREVAAVFGARVLEVPWTADFSAARNVGLNAARGRWILVMDADEALSAGDHAALRRLVNETPEGSAAFTLTTRNYINRVNAVGWRSNGDEYPADAAGFGWFPSDKVRLFPNRPDVRFSFPVHELVEPSLAAAAIEVRSCPVSVHHYGKLDDAATTKKGERYFDIGMQKLAQMAEDPAALKELAIQALNLQRWAEAVSLWERLDRMRPGCADVLVNLGTAYLNTGRAADGVAAATRAVAAAPEMKEAWFNLAFAHLHAGAPGEAVPVLEDLCRRHDDYSSARFLLAAARAAAGDGAGARRDFKALKSAPLGDVLNVSCRTLVKSLEDAGQTRAAAALMDAAGVPGTEAA